MDLEERVLFKSDYQNEDRPEMGLWGLILTPVKWFRMLVEELHWSFVLGVVIVHGISQGIGTGLGRVSTQYYMKDVQKVQPSESQVYHGIIQIPWILKPLWGLFTDVVPVFGYQRRPYFIFAGVVGVISMLFLSLQKKPNLLLALLSLTGGSAGVAIAAVTIDACVIQHSLTHPSLAGDMQSLSGLNSSIGALLGFTASGFLLRLVGPQGVFGLLSILFGLLIVLGMVIKETHIRSFAYRGVNEKFHDAGKAMWKTLKSQDVWRSCFYMYLSLAFGLDIREGLFYWFTDAKTGLAFSQEVVGSIFSFAAAGSLSGVLLFQNFFKNHPFHGLQFWTQLLYAASGLLDLIMVLRINVRFGLPDFFFVVIDEAVSHMILRLKWMPLLVLSSKLCPPGVEGTFFALFMSIDHIGLMSSSWAGGLLLHFLNITRTQFKNLWLAILIRSISRLVPIGLLFLVPRRHSKKGDEVLKIEKIEMAPLVNDA